MCSFLYTLCKIFAIFPFKSVKNSVYSRGVKKKHLWYCFLGGGGQKRKKRKKKFCTLNDQFKQIFFVGGFIFTEKNQKN